MARWTCVVCRRAIAGANSVTKCFACLPNEHVYKKCVCENIINNIKNFKGNVARAVSVVIGDV